MQWIESAEQLDELKEEHDLLVLFFYGGFSTAAQRALDEVEDFAQEQEDVPVCGIDVEKVRGVHKELGVESVPTVLMLRDGEVVQSLEGVYSKRFYAVALAGAAPSRAGDHSEAKSPRNIVVYTGPGCPACGGLKMYLRQNGIRFREVDVSRNESAAKRLMRRSGQMAVPQTDIDGHLVVGFRKDRLDSLLGIESERSEL